ncbi:MAG: c-type cytochrome domain-containing protein [Bacteroidales bacterium]
MNTKHLKIIAFFFLAFIVMEACKHSSSDVPGPGPGPDTTLTSGGCNPDTVYFVNTILPLLQSNCAMSGCHDAASHKGGVIMTDYQNIINTGKVKAGNPTDSKLYKVIIKTDNERMPPPPMAAFTSEQIAKVRKWIEQGAKNNRCTETQCDSVNVSFASHVFPIIQTQCMGCHGATNPSGGISLTNYQQIAAVAVNNNKLLGTIKHLPGYVAMPPSGKLDNCSIAKISKWISDGTPNN